MNSTLVETKSLTIVFTDMGGFTALTSLKSRSQISRLLDTLNSLVSSEVKKFKGEIVKNLGDGHLIVFESPTNAVLCGLAIQEATDAHNTIYPEEKYDLRIAVNSGEVDIRGEDVFGEPVNIASRVLSITEPGKIYLTENVFLSMNKNEIPVSEVGEKRFKGIPEPIKIYKAERGSVSGRDNHHTKVLGNLARHLKYGAVFAGLIILFGNLLADKEVEQQTLGEENSIEMKKEGDVSSQTATPATATQEITPQPTDTGDLEEEGLEEESLLEDILKNAHGKFKGLFKKDK